MNVTLKDVLKKYADKKSDCLTFPSNFKPQPHPEDLKTLQDFLNSHPELTTVSIMTKLPEEWLITLTNTETIKKMVFLQTITPNTVKAIAHRLTSEVGLKELSIYNNTLDIQEIITALANNTTLEGLAVSGETLTESDVLTLAHKENIKELRLSNTPPISAVAAEALCSNPTLVVLSLNLNSESAAVFAKHQKECELNIRQRSDLSVEDVITIMGNPHLTVKLPKDKLEWRYHQLLLQLQNKLETKPAGSPLRENMEQFLEKIKHGKDKNEKIEELIDTLQLCSDFFVRKTSNVSIYHRGFNTLPSSSYWKEVRDIAQMLPYEYAMKRLRRVNDSYGATQSELKRSVEYFIQKIEEGKAAGEPIKELTYSLQDASLFLEGSIDKKEYNRRRKGLVSDKVNSVFWARINACLVVIGLLAVAACFIIPPLPVAITVGLVGVGMFAGGMRFFCKDRRAPLLSNKAADDLVTVKTSIALSAG